MRQALKTLVSIRSAPEHQKCSMQQTCRAQQAPEENINLKGSSVSPWLSTSTEQ